MLMLASWSGAVAGNSLDISTTPAVAAVGTETSSPVPSHVQVLAGSCAACHGTDGNSIGGNSISGNSVSGTPVLAGLEHDYFVLQMQAFRSGERSATVMQRHAKGLTVEEIEQLATYFSQQKRIPGSLPPAQLMDIQHDD